MKKVIVYGTGASAESFIEKYSNVYQIESISDGKPQPSSVFGLPFISTDEIAQQHYDYIVVASWAINDISERLIHAGVNKHSIAWYPHNQNRVVHWEEFSNYEQHFELQASQVLYAFYDLDVAKATYDIPGFLCLADKQRRKLGLDKVHVVIVCASNNTFNIADRSNFSVSEHEWRKRQILQQCCALLPSLSGISMTSTKAEAQQLLLHSHHVFPEGYTVAKPIAAWAFSSVFECSTQPEDIAILDAPSEAKKIVKNWLASLNVGERRVITVTLRQSETKPSRNSNIAAWQQFIARLDTSRYFPIVIPDTGDVSIPEFAAEVFVAASLNVEVRMALYVMAHVNLGVNNGPLCLCMLSHKCNYIMYKIVTEEYHYCSTKVLEDRGFIVNGDCPIATPRQKMIWQDDSLDVIEQAFEQFETHFDSQD